MTHSTLTRHRGVVQGRPVAVPVPRAACAEGSA
jgi:hypothetical protein